VLVLKPVHLKEQSQVAENVLVRELGRSRRSDCNNQNEPDYHGQPLSTNALSTLKPNDATCSHVSSTVLQRSQKERGKKSTGHIDWNAELEEFYHVTSIMKTKFDQLMKLKNVMQSHQVTNEKQPKNRPRTAGTLNHSRPTSRSAFR
jgi:transketolase